MGGGQRAYIARPARGRGGKIVGAGGPGLFGSSSPSSPVPPPANGNSNSSNATAAFVSAASPTSVGPSSPAGRHSFPTALNGEANDAASIGAGAMGSPSGRLARGRGGRVGTAPTERSGSAFSPTNIATAQAQGNSGHPSNTSSSSPSSPYGGGGTATGASAGSGVSAIRSLATEHHFPSPQQHAPNTTAVAAAAPPSGTAAAASSEKKQPPTTHTAPTPSANHEHYKAQYAADLPSYQFPRDSVVSLGGAAPPHLAGMANQRNGSIASINGNGGASPASSIGVGPIASTGFHYRPSTAPQQQQQQQPQRSSAGGQRSTNTSAVGEDDIYAMHGL